jgi:short subunit dehydrogenase-like uncharacterized protein
MSSDKLDVIIFGASGYTGKYTVYEGVKVLRGLKWGIAGRNRAKLESVLAEMGKKAGEDLSKIPIILADIEDHKSLVEMAKQAKVIVNCCGPYRFYGENVSSFHMSAVPKSNLINFSIDFQSMHRSRNKSS